MSSCSIVAKDIKILKQLDPDECSDVCPVEALIVTNDGVETEPSRCLVCLACMALCGPDKVMIISDWVCTET